MVKDSKTCLIIVNFFKKCFCQDIFISCRRNFSQEDWVISVNIWLCLTCESWMQTVASLVNQGKEIVQSVLPVQKHESIGIIGTTWVGAWTFPFVRVDINPTFRKGCMNLFTILLTKDSQDFLCFLEGFFISKSSLCLRKWCINIIHLKLIKFQHLLTQIKVTVQKWQMLIHWF